ncbi:MAG TPA: CsbD family protein [Alphaproteobacteria bacterium]|nr:CsbD family protein [Alphaproteobacteria bacterium]
MDKDRIEGAGHEAKGKIKEVAGKVTGDKKTEAEGTAEKVGGKVENTVGGIRDKIEESKH